MSHYKSQDSTRRRAEGIMLVSPLSQSCEGLVVSSVSSADGNSPPRGKHIAHLAREKNFTTGFLGSAIHAS